MIVDSSAVLAILHKETDGGDFATVLASRPSSMSAATYVECSIVWDRRNRGLPRALDQIISMSETTLVPFTPDHAALAREAYRRYGRGSGHPAALDFGDCMSYAVAVAEDQPLLFKGDDFTQTDVRDARAETDEPTL
ncbi:MAG: type II toxin-antitoxin system VapC family toxin [Dermatophilaceae bacterium]|nr:type II toxin-antitoxin system VapC family toxin [Intrasporangiaceae bacterium]